MSRLNVLGFDDVEDYLTQLGNDFAQKTVFEADKALKIATPVGETGRLRLGWQIGENAISTDSPEPDKIHPEGKAGSPHSDYQLNK